MNHKEQSFYVELVNINVDMFRLGFSANWHCPFSSLWQLDNVLMQISAYLCQNEEYDNAVGEMVFMWRQAVRLHPSAKIVHRILPDILSLTYF